LQNKNERSESGQMRGEIIRTKPETNLKTKRQLFLEMEALRTRLDAREQRSRETHETLQAAAQTYAESIVETVREPWWCLLPA